MTTDGNLASEERRARLRSMLDVDGKVRISTAAEELEVSEMTIRRDLSELEGTGVVRRVRGGAVAVGPVPFANRHGQRSRAKATIARKLEPMVPARGAVALDASSTVMRLASTLRSGLDLVVITNGIEVFSALDRSPGLRPVLTGGEHDVRTGSLVGPLACRAAASVVATRFFCSAAGVDPVLGSTEACLEEAEVKRAFASVADEVVLAVDSSKLDTRDVAVAFTWDQVSVLVTDLDPTDRRLDPYRDVVELR